MAKTTNLRRRRVNQRSIVLPKSRLLAFNQPIVLLILCPLLLAGIASRVHLLGRSFVAFLRERVGSDDVLFVHPTMREQFKHYTRFYPIVAQRIIHGNLGKPCCPRHDYRPPEQESEKEIIDEISSLKNAAASRRLWVLMTNRRLHWVHMRRNDIEMLDRA
jgi:hypothetical protein